MMNRLYTYYPVTDGEDYYWEILETATEQVIDQFYFEDDCKEYLYFLESGGAFAGFTPSFMLNKVVQSIDEAFTALYSDKDSS